jgi:epoxyqueuosine reductase
LPIHTLEEHASVILDIKDFCCSRGADCAGVADLAPFKQGWIVLPANLLDPYTRAISIARRLDDEVINEIDKGPTVRYADHYRTVNNELDAITAEVVRWIAERGYQARAVPASLIADDAGMLGNISHKAVARMAGIGWQGKSLLIVNPEHGPRIRLATVLTDMPLNPDSPLKNRCGACVECAKACPVSAMRNVNTKDRYDTREDALYFSRCAEQTRRNKELPGISARICGVCVKVCPFGRKRRTRSSGI